jgi:hypothetical protein
MAPQRQNGFFASYKASNDLASFASMGLIRAAALTQKEMPVKTEEALLRTH